MTTKPIDAAIASFRASKPKAKLPRRYRPLYPASAERLYRRRLLSMVTMAQGWWREMVVPVVRQTRTDSVARMDDVPTLEGAIRNWAGRVASLFNEGNAKMLADDIATEVDSFNRRQVAKELVKLTPMDMLSFGPSTRPFVQASVVQNVTLIKDVGEQIQSNVSRTVTDGVLKGLRPEAIVKQVEQGLDGRAGVFNKVRTRAELIARDQVSSLNGALTKERNKGLGIELYEWQTAGDARVRDSHAELNGKIFSWGEQVTISGKTYGPAPGGIFPGSEINCRCVASPVFMETEE